MNEHNPREYNASEHGKTEKKDMSKANLVLALVLGLIAFSVAMMPFFYLRDQVM